MSIRILYKYKCLFSIFLTRTSVYSCFITDMTYSFMQKNIILLLKACEKKGNLSEKCENSMLIVPY